MGKRVWINPTTEKVDGKVRHRIEYTIWKSLMTRVKGSEKFLARNPTYSYCTIVPQWRSYDVWLEWAEQQIGFLSRDSMGRSYQLDKDILVKGNKHYSPETCVFVPHSLNSFTTTARSIRGKCLIGVSWEEARGKFASAIVVRGKRTALGRFETETEAFMCYKFAKESLAKELATDYQGLVDIRVIVALQNFNVELGD